MDRHDAKPRRPSLLAGAPLDAASAEAARPSPARILAELPQATGPRRAWPHRRGAWLAVTGLVAVCVVAGIGLVPDPVYATRGHAPTAATENAADPVDAIAQEQARAATIIEEPAPTLRADDASASTPDGPATADEPLQPGDGKVDRSRPADTNPFAVAPGSVPTTRARAPRARPETVATDEPDLLEILLGNIRSTRDSTVRDVDGMDALVRRVHDRGGAASAGGSQRPLRLRSEQIQSNLRECPPPDTAKGLECREAICAVYAGRDPACPANG